MEKIKYYLEKYKIIIILSLLGIILVSSLLYTFIRPNKKEEINQVEFKEKAVKEEKTIYDKIKVDIKGYIYNPGVYEMDINSRVIDQTTPNMIQRISGIFERNALISKEI